MQKIKNIEFLRTFLIVMIVLLHVCAASSGLGSVYIDIPLFAFLKKSFYYSNNSVEGFFIIAGFLLVLTFKNIPIGEFIKKKYIRLVPPIAFSMVICAIGRMLGTNEFSVIPNILTTLLLNQFGICFASGENSILWFTSVLFSGMILYFCIMKFVPERYKGVLMLLLAVAGYGILEYFKHGSFGKPLTNYCYIFNVGFLRGLGGLGLGAFFGLYYKKYYDKIVNFVPNLWQKIVITLSEFVSLSYIIWWSCFVHSRKNCIFYVLVFAFLFMLFVLKKGRLSSLFDNDIWVKLGKYQYSLYVTHFVLYAILLKGFCKLHSDILYNYPAVVLFGILIIIFAVGILTYYFVEEPCAKYLKGKFCVQKSIKGQS